MILKFSGPQFLETAHARLLYKRFSLTDDLHFNTLYQFLVDIDAFIESSPKINLAHDGAFLYFFGDKAHEFWIGREITGFLPRSVKEFESFDSFRGEALSWDLMSENFEEWTLKDWKGQAHQLRSLAPEALAPTWRVKMSSLEPHGSESFSSALPQISFQFFKNH